ncbi:MAG: hypothetical protein VB934_16365 [Polyangiaceae bacterium]
MVSVNERWWIWLVLVLAVAVTFEAQAAEPPFTGDRVYDLVIRGGLVVDGSGQVPRRASVVIQTARSSTSARSPPPSRPAKTSTRRISW